MKTNQFIIFILLSLFNSYILASTGQITLECKEDEEHKAHIIAINYDLGTALYLSPNRLITNTFPSSTLNSFKADKDVSTIGIAGNFIILEKTSFEQKYINSTDKIEKFSWYEKRVIEIKSNDKAALTRFWGSNLNNLSKSAGTCVIVD